MAGNMETDMKNDFLIYVMEEYKFIHNMTGKKVVELFAKYNIFDYIIRHYEALHTTGGLYIVDDIDSLISSR